VQSLHLNPRRTIMNAKSFALAALLALPAAAPALANDAPGAALLGSHAEIRALDASSFAIGIGSRRGGGIGVVVGGKTAVSQPRKPVRTTRVRIF
jgi:hypothetical protein